MQNKNMCLKLVAYLYVITMALIIQGCKPTPAFTRKDISFRKTINAKENAMTQNISELQGENPHLLFQETFDNPVLDFEKIWHPVEGQGKAWVDVGKLAMKEDRDEVGMVLWIKKTFPSDMRLQFDLSFNNNNGIGVFFIAAKGTAGEDILADQPPRITGIYTDYIKGDINCYGFSLHRFYPDGRHNPGSNLRKNKGFIRVSQALPDPAMNANQTYKVAIIKKSGHLRLWVDDNLIHNWQDKADHGDILTDGKIGFRLCGHNSCIMYLDNIIVTSLSSKD